MCKFGTTTITFLTNKNNMPGEYFQQQKEGRSKHQKKEGWIEENASSKFSPATTYNLKTNI